MMRSWLLLFVCLLREASVAKSDRGALSPIAEEKNEQFGDDHTEFGGFGRIASHDNEVPLDDSLLANLRYNEGKGKYLDGLDDKRMFKFGKKAYLPEEAPENSGYHALQRKMFKFGKRTDMENALENEKEIFDGVKRPFKFGKKASQSFYNPYMEGIRDFGSGSGEFYKRKFKFGKRREDVNDDSQLYDGIKRQFKFGKRDNFDVLGDENDSFEEAKRKFKFGKRSLTENSEVKRKFKFGKRSVQINPKRLSLPSSLRMNENRHSSDSKGSYRSKYFPGRKAPPLTEGDGGLKKYPDENLNSKHGANKAPVGEGQRERPGRLEGWKFFKFGRR